ncbi:hypothetical protein AKJ16_DCAP22098, partial [Drosera capensis]
DKDGVRSAPGGAGAPPGSVVVALPAPRHLTRRLAAWCLWLAGGFRPPVSDEWLDLLRRIVWRGKRFGGKTSRFLYFVLLLIEGASFEFPYFGVDTLRPKAARL